MKICTVMLLVVIRILTHAILFLKMEGQFPCTCLEVLQCSTAEFKEPENCLHLRLDFINVSCFRKCKYLHWQKKRLCHLKNNKIFFPYVIANIVNMNEKNKGIQNISLRDIFNKLHQTGRNLLTNILLSFH